MPTPQLPTVADLPRLGWTKVDVTPSASVAITWWTKNGCSLPQFLELIGFQRWVIGAYDKRVSWSDWAGNRWRPEGIGAVVELPLLQNGDD